MNAQIFLETERMYFRQFRAEEAKLLFDLDNDPEAARSEILTGPTGISTHAETGEFVILQKPGSLDSLGRSSWLLRFLAFVGVC